MVVIRLSRGGAKRRPFYHIVVSDKRSARDGRCIERIGYFNPISSGQDIRLHLDHEKSALLDFKGAQPSDRVRQLIKLSENKQKTRHRNNDYSAIKNYGRF